MHLRQTVSGAGSNIFQNLLHQPSRARLVRAAHKSCAKSALLCWLLSTQKPRTFHVRGSEENGRYWI